MLTFAKFPYHTPDIDLLRKQFKEKTDVFVSAKDYKKQRIALQEIYVLRGEFSSMSDIARIRHTLDTRDPYYQAQNDFFDENSPVYEGLVTDFYKALLSSPYRAELEQEFGKQLFALASLTIKTFRLEITEDLQLENRLSSEYQQLLASASIPFEGAERNLSEISAFLSEAERATRKDASEAKWGFMAEHKESLDRIFSDLVAVRTRIAKKLGYENFIQLGYDRMLRSDYSASEVATFRELIRKHFVPLASRLREEQAGRLGLASLKYYDEPLTFPDGNARPKGDPAWITAQGQKMYNELSPETGTWYQYMVDRDLMDLEARKGKAGGGYCTFVSSQQAPYIFANFNGTEEDVFVLTHEAGHAFQIFMSRNQLISEYHWPTYEACEIHSMSMEYFTWPYMDLFFGEQAEKYRFGHLLSSLLFLPYGAAVDEFQHEVYANPDLNPDERHQAWRRIEKKYLPHREYEENAYLENGGYWQLQRHIYQSPFYYIDYVLAQLCAFQFWIRAQQDREQAFGDYVKLCSIGGSRAFLELVEYAGLRSPFDPEAVQEVVATLEAYLQTTKVTL